MAICARGMRFPVRIQVASAEEYREEATYKIHGKSGLQCFPAPHENPYRRQLHSRVAPRQRKQRQALRRSDFPWIRSVERSHLLKCQSPPRVFEWVPAARVPETLCERLPE